MCVLKEKDQKPIRACAQFDSPRSCARVASEWDCHSVALAPFCLCVRFKATASNNTSGNVRNASASPPSPSLTSLTLFAVRHLQRSPHQTLIVKTSFL